MEFITNFIYQYGTFAMFLLILLEYACFPISSEIVLPFSGAIASLQHIPFHFILPLSIIAALIGTSLCYFAGYFGGTSLLKKLTLHFPKSEKAIDSSIKKFQQLGSLALCISRIIPICRTYIALIAGISKYSYSNFIFMSAIGISLWNFALIGCGYYLREHWNMIGTYYNQYKFLFFFLLFLIIIYYLFRKKIIRK